MKMNKVCSNLQQDFTEAEKLQARINIGAAASGEVNGVKYITDNTVTYNQVSEWYEAGNLVIYKVPTSNPQVLLYKDASDNFHFVDMTNNFGFTYRMVLTPQGEYTTASSAVRYKRFDGGMCAVMNDESYDTVGKLWTLNSCAIPLVSNGEIQFEYMAYHSGTLYATSHIGQIDMKVEGFRHNYLNNSGTVTETWNRISDTIRLNNNERTNLNIFNLSTQELAASDFTSVLDVTISVNIIGSDAWSSPISVRATKTADGHIMMSGGC